MHATPRIDGAPPAALLLPLFKQQAFRPTPPCSYARAMRLFLSSIARLQQQRGGRPLQKHAAMSRWHVEVTARLADHVLRAPERRLLSGIARLEAWPSTAGVFTVDANAPWFHDVGSRGCLVEMAHGIMSYVTVVRRAGADVVEGKEEGGGCGGGGDLMFLVRLATFVAPPAHEQKWFVRARLNAAFVRRAGIALRDVWVYNAGVLTHTTSMGTPEFGR